MKFLTLVELPNYDFSISHSDNCVFIGSCFAENIGNKLSQNKFKAFVNPTGIHYNPLSLAKSIEMAINSELIQEKNIFQANSLFNNFNFHSKFSKPSKKEAILSFNSALKQLRNALICSKFLFVTFGTSMVYKNKTDNSIVSNCHKLPAKQFTLNFLDCDDIVSTWLETIELLRKENSGLKIIFSLSPIRHLRDGAIQNQQSKANLCISIKKIIERTENSYYFPAFEIVNDELRDYRFYAEDMIHPSALTIDYIYEKFSESFFDTNTKILNKKIENIINAKNHKVFNPKSEEHKKFCMKVLNDIENLKNTALNFSDEKAYFNSFL